MAEPLSPRTETRHLWYQVQYSRTAQDANDGLREQSARVAAARLRARKLALVGASTLLSYGQSDPRGNSPRIQSPFGSGARRRRRLTRFLMETVEPSTLIVLAALSERSGVRHLPDRYALVQCLEEGLDIHPRALIRYVRRNDSLSYRAAYNLACYYAGRIEHDPGYSDDALCWLRRALRDAPRDEQTTLARWAGDDPSFADLQEEKEFVEIVAYYADAPIPHEHHETKSASPEQGTPRPLADA